MKILVTGFGSFPGVERNPTEALALALDGLVLGSVAVTSLVLPVSYRRGPAAAVAAALERGADLVVGFGVSRRAQIEVERRALLVREGRPDIDGETATGLDGPDEIFATLDAARLAELLSAGLSDDAGRYVCNAWLYEVTPGRARRR